MGSRRCLPRAPPAPRPSAHACTSRRSLAAANLQRVRLAPALALPHLCTVRSLAPFCSLLKGSAPRRSRALLAFCPRNFQRRWTGRRAALTKPRTGACLRILSFLAVLPACLHPLRGSAWIKSSDAVLSPRRRPRPRPASDAMRVCNAFKLSLNTSAFARPGVVLLLTKPTRSLPLPPPAFRIPHLHPHDAPST